MRRAETTPMPGTRSKSWYEARLTSRGKTSGWRRAQQAFGSRSKSKFGTSSVKISSTLTGKTASASRLIQSVFPKKGRLCNSRQVGSRHSRHVGRIIDALHIDLVIQGLAEAQDRPVAVRRRPDDELCRLAGRHKGLTFLYRFFSSRH